MTIDAFISIANMFPLSSVLSEANMRILVVLLEIVIGLALVGTVATSTSTGSTALAAFTSAQALVIIIPLIFVAVILYAAVRHVSGQGKGKGLLIFEPVVLLTRAISPRVEVFAFRLRLYQRP